MPFLPFYQRLSYCGLEPSQVIDIVYGSQFEHRLLSARRANMDHERLVLDPVRLDTGSYDFPVIARGAMPRGVVCIGMMAGGRETTHYNTSEIGEDEVQIYPSGAEVLYHATDASRWINLNVPEDSLQEAAIAQIGRPLELPRRDAVSVRLMRGGRRALVRMADEAFELARTSGSIGLSPMLGAVISSGLIAGYAHALSSARPSKSGRRQATSSFHLHLVLACERLATPDRGFELDVDDIAKRSGYSRRSLELIFNKSVGVPPARWFMNLRLNGALRELLAAEPGCRVADVAARWGFRHLPRFADYYRRAFGELPGHTLAQALSR
jgi:AraC-like DNA-binding protein